MTAPPPDPVRNAAVKLPSPFAAGWPVADFAMPTHRHVPGSGSAPDLATLEPAKARVPSRTDAARWQQNAAYLYGRALFDAGFYWEAHEIWEAVWLNCRPNSAERHLLQALIQYANARLKHAMGRSRAANRLVAACAGHLRRVPDVPAGAATAATFMGVDCAGWRAHLETSIAANDHAC